ncbi:7768_t:CDS:2, partial [Gigaspora rosea]
LIHDEATTIANSYPEKLKADYLKALEQLRFPYWDWASPVTLEKGVPSVFWDETVEVDTPRGKKSIPNPLRSYTLPRDLGTLQLAGNSANPTKRPYKPDGNMPFTPKGYSTIRHPDSNYVSNQDGTSLAIVTSCNTTYRPSLYQLFNYVKTWKHFSNHGDTNYSVKVKAEDGTEKDVKPQTETFGHYTSIEFIHDGVHAALGGQGGHMANPDIAAFDPIFFLHHCNVDRLIAIWQAINPNAWLNESDLNNTTDPLKDKKLFTEGTFTQEPRVAIDENTPLTPFRKSENEYWTSKGVRDVVALGYTYPELHDNIDKEKNQKSFDRYKCAKLKKYMIGLYRQIIGNLLQLLKKNAADGPYELRVFLDIDHADKDTSKNCPNFAGLISVFARTKETQCANCKAHPDAVVHGNVDLTNCMQALNINVNSNALQPQQIKFVAVSTNSNKQLNWEDLVTQADLFKSDESSNDHTVWSQTHVATVYPKS